MLKRIVHSIFSQLITLASVLQPDIYYETIAVSGSISAEHGVGIAKAKYLKDAVGDVALGKMEGIKRLFDPAGVMNPGKLFSGLVKKDYEAADGNH